MMALGAFGCGGDDGSSAAASGSPILGNIPCLDLGAVATEPGGDRVFSPERLEQLLDAVVASGVTTMTLAEFAATDATKLPDKPALLVFSVASAAFYKTALPALEARKLKATLAVRTDILTQPWAMTRSMLQDAEARGIEIASQGAGEVNLTTLDAAALTEHVAGSKKVLVTDNGLAVSSFVYPLGEHDDDVRAAVGQAGYTAARALSAATIAGGGYASAAPGRRFWIGCTAPTIDTTDAQIGDYLGNSKLELEDVYTVQTDEGKLGKITRGNFTADHYGHVVLSDEGDTISIPLVFRRAGNFRLRVRAKSGTEAHPKATEADYKYTLDGQFVVHVAEGEPTLDPANKNVAWIDHVVHGVTIAESGVHTLQVRCLKDWSCLLDWLAVEPL